MKVICGLVAATLAACACPHKASTTAGGGSGSVGAGSGSAVTPAAGCDGIRAKVEGFYRAEAQAKEPTRVDDAVADNTAMVMKDCAKDPAKVVACVSAVTTLRDLETTCLVQLDDEGTEGDASK